MAWGLLFAGRRFGGDRASEEVYLVPLGISSRSGLDMDSRLSHNNLARITGVLLLVMTVAAIFAEFGVRASLLQGDPQTVARQILDSQQTFRFGFLGYLVAYLCDVPVAVFLYLLMRETDRPLAAVMGAFRLVYTAIVAAVLLQFFGALLFLTSETSAFEAAQVHQMAVFFTALFDSGFHMSLIFFAVHLLLLGVLLYRSRRVPRALGALVAAGGVAYLLDNVLFFVAPAVQETFGPFLAMIAMGEVLLALWFVVKGIRDPQTS
jgi:hypothetical protein